MSPTKNVTIQKSTIRSITIYHKKLPLAAPYCLSGGTVRCDSLNATIVRIDTEDGYSGWGESTSWSHNYLPAFAGGVRSALELLAPFLLGQDATEVDKLNALMDHTLPGHGYAKCCIDMACWDILAQRAKLPLYALLGGRYGDGVKPNSSIATGSADEMNADIQKYRNMGYKVHSVKLGGTDPKVDIERVRGIMAALPSDESVTFDVNRAWTPAVATQVMNATANVAPGWFEQPCETMQECLTVRKMVQQPLVLDEIVDTFASHLTALQQGVCEGIKLKPLKSGGITKARRIRDLGVNVGWHMHIEAVAGTILADTAALHLALSTPEQNRMASWLSHMHLTEGGEIAPGQGARLKDGLIRLAEVPGIGVVPDFDLLGPPAAVYTQSSPSGTSLPMPGPSIETVPNVMKAMVLTGHGSLDQIKYHENWPVPKLKSGEALIRVHACGLNNCDLNMCLSWYSKDVDVSADQSQSTGDVSCKWNGKEAQLPKIMGSDVCGTVVALGPDCNDARDLLSRRVMVDPWIPISSKKSVEKKNRIDMDYLGSEVDGGYAEYCKVPISNVQCVDDLSYSDAELATVACSAVAAETMLHNASVGVGDVVLLTGASGGVGTCLLSLIKRRGATVIAVTSHSKIKNVIEFGADFAIPREAAEDVDLLRRTIKQECREDGVTVVADTVGGLAAENSLQILRQRGRYVCCGAIAGATVKMDLRDLFYHDLELFGAAQSHPSCFGDIVSYLRRGEFTPRLAKQFTLEKLHEALNVFKEKKHTGNIVVSMGSL